MGRSAVVRPDLVDLTVLGPPTISRGGEPVHFETRKAVAMVVVLAVTRRTWAREELATLLWPEADDARARGALRRTLVSASAVGPALVATRTTLALDPSQTTCDVHEFQTLVARGDTDGDRAAVDLWRGGFLAGFTLRDSPPFDDWLEAERSVLHAAYDRALGRVAEQALDDEDTALAVDAARRRLALDPLNEAAHRQVMLAHAGAGDRGPALSQYQACLRILERELGVAPLPETVAVADAIRRGTVVAARRPTVRPPAPRPAPVAGPPAPSWPYVGRSDELGALTEAWRDQAVRVVSLRGEVGVGKTRLVREFATDVRATTVVSVRGHRGEQHLAFGVAAELVRSTLSLVDARGLDSSRRASLSALVPDLGPQRPTVSSSGALHRLFDAVRGLLDTAAGVGRLLLWCDDVHWFDPESAELLAFLIRRAPASRLTVVSWGEAEPPPALMDAVGSAVADGTARVLRLAALDAPAIQELARSLGSESDDTSIDQLLMRTGGVPLLLVEHLLAGDDPRAPDVLTALDHRVASTAATTTQVLATLAILDAATDQALLHEVSGRSELEVADALDDAVRRRLVVEVGADGRATYALPHDSLRRVLLQRTGPARRRMLHARAADALAARRRRRPGTVSAASVARHLAAAGRSQDAAAEHLAAAAEARALYAHASAAFHAEAALSLGAGVAESQLAIGDARLHLGDYSAAEHAFEVAAATASEPGQRITAEHRLAEVDDRRGDWSWAIEHLEAALLIATSEGLSLEAARLHADLAVVHLHADHTTAAARHAGAAADAAGQSGDRRVLAQASNVRAALALRRRTMRAAQRHAEEALVGAESVGDRALLVAVLNTLARVASDSGRSEAAVELAERAVREGDVLGDRHRLAALHAHLADLQHERGDRQASERHALEAARLFSEVDHEVDRRPGIWRLVEW